VYSLLELIFVRSGSFSLGEDWKMQDRKLQDRKMEKQKRAGGN